MDTNYLWIYFPIERKAINQGNNSGAVGWSAVYSITFFHIKVTEACTLNVVKRLMPGVDI